MLKTPGPIGRAAEGVGLRQLACYDCGFESHQGMDAYLL